MKKKREKRLVRIEGRDPEEEKIDIPPISITFHKPAFIAYGNDEGLDFKMFADVNTLRVEEEDPERAEPPAFI